jgi:hypothetical protein
MSHFPFALRNTAHHGYYQADRELADPVTSRRRSDENPRFRGRWNIDVVHRVSCLSDHFEIRQGLKQSRRERSTLTDWNDSLWALESTIQFFF